MLDARQNGRTARVPFPLDENIPRLYDGAPRQKADVMGQEFAQYKEWNFQSQLDWEVLEFDPHHQYHNYVKAINKLYKETPALWECDTSWEGFHWISAEDNSNSVIAFRRISRKKDEVIVVCNFQPVRHEIYEIGVPYYADYEEIFNSDDVKFGGSGITNGTVTAKNEPMHDELYRVSLDIPPMSVMYFVPKNIRLPEDDEPEVDAEGEEKVEEAEAKVEKTADKTVVKNNKSQKENDK